MTRLEAEVELETYVKNNYDTKKPTIVWAIIGHTHVAKITNVKQGMLLATYTPKDGLVVFDSVAKHIDNGEWKNV